MGLPQILYDSRGSHNPIPTFGKNIYTIIVIMSYMTTVTCSGLNEDGTPCKRTTSHPSGRCPDHRESWRQGTTFTTCKNCPLKVDCEHAHAAPKGVCWYELYAEKVDLATRESLIEHMEKIIGGEIRLFERLEREQKGIPVDDIEGGFVGASKMMLEAGKNSIDHMNQLAKLRGIEDASTAKKEMNRKVKALESIFGKKKEKEQEQEVKA